MIHDGRDPQVQHQNQLHEQHEQQEQPALKWWTQWKSSRERRWRDPGMLALAFLAALVISLITAVGASQRARTPPRSASSAKAAAVPSGGAAGYSWLGVGVGVGVDAMEPKAEPKPQPKPNVFFIVIDDMGWNDVGYQSTDIHAMTPNLNRMAEGGVKLMQYYSMSICTPARAALMTGRYPVRYGFQYGIIAPGAPWGLPLKEKLLPEYMNDAGYTSHMVGKWHLGGHTYDHMPHRRGFETHLGYTYGAETYWTHQVTWNSSRSLRVGPDFLDFGYGNKTDYYDVIERPSRPPPGDYDYDYDYDSSAKGGGKYSTEVFTDRALEILNGKTPFDEEPLFLYLAHQAVHEPLELPPYGFNADESALLDALKGTSASGDRVKFAKILMYLDKTIGRLVDHLDEAGWLENSIIVVASDNGGCPSFGGSNHPLRGVKASYWEGGTKVPALVYSPSHIPEERWGKEYQGLMHVTDWLPTLAAAAEFELSGSYGDLDGVNHWEHIIKEPSSRSLVQDDGDADGTISSSISSSISSNGAYTPRSEMLYNYDPYFFVANDDQTISKPDFTQAQGAFRHGKWKVLFKVCSLDYYDPDIVLSSASTVNDRTEVGATSFCYGCAQTCVDKSACTDWLFNLEEDPLEEHNLASTYPEVVERLRERVTSVVNQDYSGSLFVGIDPNACSAWESHDYWAVPWLHHGHRSSGSKEEPPRVMDDPFRIARD